MHDTAEIRATLEAGIPVEKVNARGGGVRRRTLFLRGDTLWAGRNIARATKSIPLADLVLSHGIHGLGKQGGCGTAAPREKEGWLYLIRVSLAVGPKGQTTRGSVSTRALQLRPRKRSSTNGPLDPRALEDMLRVMCNARRSELQLRARPPPAAGGSRGAEQPGCFRTVNGVPHKSGVLQKKSRWIGSWSRCFFLVNGARLQLFELREDEQWKQHHPPEQQPPFQLPPPTAGACIEHEIVSVDDVPPPPGRPQREPAFRFEIGVRPRWGLVRLEVRCSCAAEKYAWLTTLRAVVRGLTDDNTPEIREQPSCWMACDETVDQTIDHTIERCASDAAPSDPRAVAMMRERAQVGSAGLAVPGLTTRHIAVKDNILLYA